MGACSLQFVDDSGMPRLVGLGHVTQGGDSGEVVHIVAPGVAIRAYSNFMGVTLGFADSILFLPRVGASATARLVAVQHTVYGLEIGERQVALGYDRTFAIALPSPRENVIQELHYSAENPAAAHVSRKEFP
jgi:hypothetical protein